MVDGAVSIAVRSVYPSKQAGLLLLSDVLQETKTVAGKVARRALSSIGYERRGHHR